MNDDIFTVLPDQDIPIDPEELTTQVNEGFEGFVAKAQKIPSFDVGVHRDITFSNSPTAKKSARSLKRAFSEESDQAFFQSLTKVHWFNGAVNVQLPWFFQNNNKNEVAVTGYNKNRNLSNPKDWWPVGLELQGRATVASNNMDAMFTGYSQDIPTAEKNRFKSSGVPKRPTMFWPPYATDYALDAKSFSNDSRNEIVLDNWRPVALILLPPIIKILVKASQKFDSNNIRIRNVIMGISWFCNNTLLPIKDKDQKEIDRQYICELCAKADQLALQYQKRVTQESVCIFTTKGNNMSIKDLKQFINEVLAEPAPGQRFKSTRSMPITMSSGRDIQITDVEGQGDNMVVTFTIKGHDGTLYTIRRRWSDILNKGESNGEWFEAIAEATKTYGNKTYKASAGSVSAIKKSGDSAKKAVGAGKFDWSDQPWAAAQAAHIVATGEPTVKKGTKKKKTSESDKHEVSKCEDCGATYEGSHCNKC